MSVKDLKKKLNNILTKDESVVVSINGKWGVGKTYFWSLSKSSKHTIISLKSCLSGKVIPMPIYGIVISLMCFAVACQAFCFFVIKQTKKKYNEC
jgi:hypothetical protein